MFIIFPIDVTTTFLADVIVYLYSKTHNSKFHLFKINVETFVIDNLINEINNSRFETIVYLGHGSSSSLSAFNDERNTITLLNLEDFRIFTDKKLLLLSCNSNQLLVKAKKYQYKEAIGFGNLPTDWNDVKSAREFDINAYKGITDESIELFKQSLVNIIKFSLVDSLNEDLSFKQLFNLITLRINKKIAYNYKNNVKEHIVLNDLLLLMKQEATYL